MSAVVAAQQAVNAASTAAGSHGPNLVPVVTLLAAAVIAVPLFKRLGLGAVLGYLAAGLLIGPSVLGLIHDPATILQTAELGVVMFLFIVGLEMRPAHLWQMRRQIFGLGVLQVGLAMALLTPVGVVIGAWLGRGLDWEQAWVAGTGFVLTSTAIVMQMLVERKQLASPAGQKVVSILLLEDLLIVPLLAIVTFIAPGGHEGGHVALGWQVRALNIGLALGAFLVLLAVGRWLLNPLFVLLSAVRSREVMTAAALLVVLGAALWMDLGGLSTAMGAFIAGVMLAESSFRHQLEADVEPFKGLLLGLFFLAVGMSMDLTVIAAQWQLVLGSVVAYMLLKSAAIYLIARLVKTSHEVALERMVLMAQGGEFAFVLYAAATSVGLMEAEVNSVYTAVIILSMVLTPLMLIAHGRWVSRCARRRINEPERAYDTEMDHSPVIIAGFGRFGQMVGRLLLANGIVSTIMDSDAEHIESMRQFGFHVYYGDATRLDLLQAAGAAQAKVLVVAVDDKEAAKTIVERVRQAYPHLQVFARAYDVSHYYDLRRIGAHVAQREVYESSLRLGRHVLETLGVGAYEAKEMADGFRLANEKQVDAFARMREKAEFKDYIQAIRTSREELERQLREETAQRGKEGHDWEASERRAHDERP
ncbi:potassium transporter [Hylemonella gracilis]|uniref:Potassium transporter n=1 Tax=Hylemonella gracilis TaxID=80880 RepID=A0A4P6UES9_9BURK|nr:monovalent cation:proton antiporter-2 (CPA2) family protein [Hylemonella gracilis]QBK03522.1 potassium transporter [Hylemonella gracilis]